MNLMLLIVVGVVWLWIVTAVCANNIIKELRASSEETNKRLNDLKDEIENLKLNKLN